MRIVHAASARPYAATIALTVSSAMGNIYTNVHDCKALMGFHGQEAPFLVAAVGGLVCDDVGGTGHFAVQGRGLGTVHFVPVGFWVFSDCVSVAAHPAPLVEAVCGDAVMAGTLADRVGGLVWLGRCLWQFVDL